MESKIIHGETYKGLHIVLSAKYSNTRSIKVNGKLHAGKVILYCEIFDGESSVASVDSLFGCIHEYSPHRIGYDRKYERYGFLKLKRKEHLVHISDEYDRVYPLFLDYCRAKAGAIVKRMNRDKDAQEITDGLPDSLKIL